MAKKKSSKLKQRVKPGANTIPPSRKAVLKQRREILVKSHEKKLAALDAEIKNAKT